MFKPKEPLSRETAFRISVDVARAAVAESEKEQRRDAERAATV